MIGIGSKVRVVKLFGICAGKIGTVVAKSKFENKWIVAFKDKEYSYGFKESELKEVKMGD